MRRKTSVRRITINQNRERASKRRRKLGRERAGKFPTINIRNPKEKGKTVRDENELSSSKTKAQKTAS